ncbi:MAG: hypothetical protein D6744_12930, partial [Planctomycetota bacterium]
MFAHRTPHTIRELNGALRRVRSDSLLSAGAPRFATRRPCISGPLDEDEPRSSKERSMWPAISGSAFSDAPSAAQQIRRAAEAGFRGVELHIAGATSRDDFVGRFRPAEIRELASEQDVRIASLSVNSGVNLASDDPEALPRAAEWLDCAAAIGAERLIFSPVASLSAHEPQQRIAYADAYARTL